MSDTELGDLVKVLEKESKGISEIISSTDFEISDDDTLVNKSRNIIHKMINSGKLLKKNENLSNKIDEIFVTLYRPGKLYLATWSGSRKGSGTYYTRPRLVYPTVERVIKPLCYSNKDQNKIKTPSEILELNVLDPAMGSGSFLVSATRLIAKMLLESIQVHKQIKYKKGSVEITIGDDLEIVEFPNFGDSMRLQQVILNRLKRFVVEDCIYGVDINPFAVELAKLSLWLETMDYQIPFKFLDHKFKVGNSLVGAWLKDAFHFPIKAFSRKTADFKHRSLEINHPSKRDHTILKKEREIVSDLLRNKINSENYSPLLGFFDEILESKSGIVDNYKKIKELKSRFENENVIQENYIKYRTSVEYIDLKIQCDRWCALWFIKIEHEIDFNNISSLSKFDKSFKSPNSFITSLNEKERSRIDEISNKMKFFHWELEFPNVFLKENPGFDAVIGNPPWEVFKPNSKEFFSNYDPLFLTYGKKTSEHKKKSIFKQDPGVEEEWLDYNETYVAMRNYLKESSDPYALAKIDNLSWAQKRSAVNDKLGINDFLSPYQYQGMADLNTYKMFTEIFLTLSRDKGRIGLIVPSGIYSDDGTKDIRSFLLDQNKWEWLFSFHNRKKIFPIHSSFKFCIIIVEKGNLTDQINTSFMRVDLDEWENIDYLSESIIPINPNDIEKFSPEGRAFVEITNSKDLVILRKLFDVGSNLGRKFESDWKLGYRREFHSDDDSKIMIDINTLDIESFSNNQDFIDFGIIPYRTNDKLTYLFPIYQGRNIDIGDYASQSYKKGAGNRAKYEFTELERKRCVTQFYMDLNSVAKKLFVNYYDKIKPKIAFRDITNATNSRTMIPAVIPNFPTVTTMRIFLTKKEDTLELYPLVYLSSFVFDFIVRRVLVGTHLILNIVSPLPLPTPKNEPAHHKSIKFIFNLFLNSPVFCHYWLNMRKTVSNLIPPIKYWALSKHERLRIMVILNIIAAKDYGVTKNELHYILNPSKENIRGFWRVDQKKPQEVRLTTLTLLGYDRLLEVGFEQFIEEDWQFPQHIQDQLGPRFLDWQLEMTEEEAWQKCEEYAARLDKIYESVDVPLKDNLQSRNKSKKSNKTKEKDDNQQSLEGFFEG